MILLWLREGGNEGDQNGIDESKMLCKENSAKDWMIDFVRTKSVWTIDLVVLLEHVLTCGKTSENFHGTIPSLPGDGGQRHNNLQQLSSFGIAPIPSFSYLFCSTNFGVDESYNQLGYYKDAFSADELRVKHLFDISKQHKLPLLRTSHISLDVLVEIVSRKGVVAIVLVDNRVLRNDVLHICSYSGHYVVLCGISNDENDVNYARHNSHEDTRDDRHNYCMVLKNPGRSQQSEFVAASVFEKAWRAKGTDEDVIFIASHMLW
ncbi:hypothetical protein ACHAWF_001814 [Thalassiosira exigua]